MPTSLFKKLIESFVMDVKLVEYIQSDITFYSGT